MNKLTLIIILCLLVITASVAYYFFIFQPQLAVNSCLESARKDFDTSKANTCKERYEIGKNGYNRCVVEGNSAVLCDALWGVQGNWPLSPSIGCQIPGNQMTTLQKDYDNAVVQCKNLGIIKLQ